MSGYVLENSNLKLEFDQQGRITGFRNKATATDLLTYKGLEDNWKIMTLTDGYPVDYILGKDQTPRQVERETTAITFHYQELRRGNDLYDIDLDFSCSLNLDEAFFTISLRNNTNQRIREIWAPILGGFEGFKEDGKPGMVNFCRYGGLDQDVLHKGVPSPEYLFVVDGETGDYRNLSWLDLFVNDQGFLLMADDHDPDLQVIRVEKFPPEVGTGSSDEKLYFPPDTPRWMKMMIGRLVAVDPGEQYTMPASIVWPHKGDWYKAADHFRAWMDSWVKWPPRPSWLKGYTGWQHIIGKTYLGEYYYNFEQMTAVMKEGLKRAGINTLMVYGHTDIGCEGANFDLTPGQTLGGPEGFRRMCDELHKLGMKVLIFTHRQSAVAMDREKEFKPFEAWAFRDRLGNIRKEEWWKTTIESLTYRNAGTGPIWSRICPYCDEWWLGFLDEIKKLHALGCDGIQMDTIGAEGSVCYASNHGHKPGDLMMPKLRDRLEWLRHEVYKMDPEFLLAGEEFGDWMGVYLDLPYSRYREKDGFQIFRYTFPDYKRNVAIGPYSYDQVNKGWMMGWGFNCEVDGLKNSIVAYPDFADFVGEVNKIRMKYADYLLNGRFLNTLKGHVDGNVRYAVHRGPNGYAAVIWNSGEASETCTFTFDETFDEGIFCEPGMPEVLITLPAKFTLKPHRAASIIVEMKA